MSDQYLGEIRPFAFNFAPRNWALCNGQIISVASNTALFSILGTTYGGNGTTTFGLPNLQGQAPIHFGSGAGLSDYVLGETVGAQNVTLTTATMPSHTHQAQATTNGLNDTNTPSGNTTLGLTAPDPIWDKVNTDPLVAFSPSAIQTAGSSLPHDNMQPYLAICFCIALQGVYPPRS